MVWAGWSVWSGQGGHNYKLVCSPSHMKCSTVFLQQTFLAFGKSEVLKSPGCQLPQTTEEWASLQPPDEVMDTSSTAPSAVHSAL